MSSFSWHLRLSLLPRLDFLTLLEEALVPGPRPGATERKLLHLARKLSAC